MISSNHDAWNDNLFLRFIGNVSRRQDPGSLSRILIFIHPGSNHSSKVGGGGGVIFCTTLFVAINFFHFWTGKEKKIWVKSQRIIVLFTIKVSIRFEKYGFGIRGPGPAKPITDPGSRGQKAPDPGSGTLLEDSCFRNGLDTHPSYFWWYL